MEKRKLGNTDMIVSELGFGGAEIGFEGATENEVADLLNGALDAGLNVIDTATGYMNSEEMIGRAVSNRRDEYYLFSKCGWSGDHGQDSWMPEAILSHIEKSLKLLRTDRLDLIQLHSCSEDILRRGDAISAVQTARDRGYTRYIGYSGDGVAAKHAICTGAFDTLQTSINIADQEVLRESLPLARERNMGVIAKRPIANAAWKTGKKPENAYHHEVLGTIKNPSIRLPQRGPRCRRRHRAALYLEPAGCPHSHRRHQTPRSLETKRRLARCRPVTPVRNRQDSRALG